MSDLFHVFKSLRRPKTLIRAARIGVAQYRREQDLKRLLRAGRAPAPGTGMSRLLTIEQDLEAIRLSGDATYSITKHVEILVALMAEARLLRRPTPG